MVATIQYWYADLSGITGYKKGYIVHEEDIFHVSNLIFAMGLNVMVCHMNDPNECVIWIDDKRFQHR